MEEIIKSVGIDIGTSTTQLIFSQLKIKNMASSFTVPRIHIVEKHVMYQSAIYFTPFLSEAIIDRDAVKKIIKQEYTAAGMTPADLKTGAVIITGDAARKENADAVIQALSDMAGDFVVATAGPDLESVVSAKGAGAAALSKEERLTIANIDIGGGTSNIAVFRKGVHVGTTCLNIGGRLIQIKDGRIRSLFPDIKESALTQGIDLEPGDSADQGKLEPLCRWLADELAQALNLKKRDRAHGFLYTNQGKPLPEDLKIDAVTFSGGVADCMGRPVDDEFQFGDIGVLLGKAIAGQPELQQLKHYPAKETIRATVVGAGSHSMNVSGSTIHYEENVLPVKNIPVLKIGEEEERTPESLALEIQNKIPLFEKEGGMGPIALAFSAAGKTTFSKIQAVARAIVQGAQPIIASSNPLIVIVENDIGKALGNALDLRLSGQKPVICLDGIYAGDGDYIDIGEPVAGGRVCPVIIKTIVFNR
ncbi:MAG: ethanolamine ammonia-lyase reactivating factor EutA [Eubacteriaceae bacterium]|nr:ethanolamine ammonia-lyase reactivating factor EutA [Eubacteriaceae bacterium]